MPLGHDGQLVHDIGDRRAGNCLCFGDERRPLRPMGRLYDKPDTDAPLEGRPVI